MNRHVSLTGSDTDFPAHGVMVNTSYSAAPIQHPSRPTMQVFPAHGSPTNQSRRSTQTSPPSSTATLVNIGTSNINSDTPKTKKAAPRASARSVRTLSKAELEKKREGDRESQRAVRERRQARYDSQEAELQRYRTGLIESELYNALVEENHSLRNENLSIRRALERAERERSVASSRRSEQQDEDFEGSDTLSPSPLQESLYPSMSLGRQYLESHANSYGGQTPSGSSLESCPRGSMSGANPIHSPNPSESFSTPMATNGFQATPILPINQRPGSLRQPQPFAFQGDPSGQWLQQNETLRQPLNYVTGLSQGLDGSIVGYFQTVPQGATVIDQMQPQQPHFASLPSSNIAPNGPMQDHGFLVSQTPLSTHSNFAQSGWQG